MNFIQNVLTVGNRVVQDQTLHVPCVVNPLMYRHIGDIVDVDGSGWVSKETALDLLYNLNIDWMS